MYIAHAVNLQDKKCTAYIEADVRVLAAEEELF